MHRCNECGTVFRHTKQYPEDTGEIFNVCPQCRSTDYDIVFKCKICGEYFTADDIYKDICYECAEKEYTDRLGLRFIEKQKDFYLEYYGVEKVDKDLKSNLIEVLEKDFTSKVDMESDWNKQLKAVKEYCLDDIDIWFLFLGEEREI